MLGANTEEAKRALGDAQRGRGDGLSYVREGGRHQHRVIAEQMLGRPLEPGEVVHHRDGDYRNNDPANLEVFPSQAEHAREHGRLRRARKEGDA
jgi:hypothetical protein